MLIYLNNLSCSRKSTQNFCEDYTGSVQRLKHIWTIKNDLETGSEPVDHQLGNKSSPPVKEFGSVGVSFTVRGLWSEMMSEIRSRGSVAGPEPKGSGVWYHQDAVLGLGTPGGG